MLSNEPANKPLQPQAYQPSGAKAGTAKAQVEALDPHSPIETAATGNGNGNDPGGTDNKPPGVEDFDLSGLV